MLGGPAVGVGGLVSLALSYVWAADLRAFVMAPVANGLKVINGVRRKKGRLIWAIFLAIVITFVLSQGLIIYQAYRIGGINASPWFFQEGPQVPYRYINTVRNQYWSGPDPTGWFLAAIGTGLMLALLLARRRFAWWPLHPIGLVVLGTWIMVQLWFSFFLAWLIKLILIRYGGPHLYAKAVPFFLGMILGQFSACAVWAVIFYLTSVPGVNLFWV
jgi:hypothetical protein